MHSEMGAFFYFILIFICRIIIFLEINYMKQTIRLTESELKNMISESVRRILKENFMDNLKTNAAYVKNSVQDYLPPMAMKHPKQTIDSIKFNIKCMEDALQNNRKCGSKFLHQYNVAMQTAQEEGYVKYYKKMKELYNQMVEEGLYENEHDLDNMSFDDIYSDIDKRVKARGNHFHG